MSTSQKRSSIKVPHTPSSVKSVALNDAFNDGRTHLTYELTIFGLKSRESLQPRIVDLWETFCEQAPRLICDSSSNETTGQQPSTPSGIPTGRQNTAASGTSGSRFRSVGPS